MKPLYFNECFGWYHGAHGRRAVVICGAVGHEALWTHKGVASFAERLARDGYPTLRFDYPDTGDSADLPPDAPRVAGWVDSIRRACRTVRALSGAQEIVLVGVRAGAALAAMAASAAPSEEAPDEFSDAASDVAAIGAIAMLAPVQRGRMLVRGMHMLDRTWRAMAGKAVNRPAADAEAGTEGAAAADAADARVLGMRYATSTLEDLSAYDLTRIPRVPGHVFVAGDAAQADPLSAHYAAAGANVVTKPFPEELGWLQDPLHGTPPTVTFDALAAWIAKLPAGRDGRPAPLPATLPAPTQERIAQAGWTETPACFGSRLRGILCEPAVPRANVPALIISNAGATHRVGAGRSGVDLARELASHGIASLRIDVRGIGDSVLSDAVLVSGCDVQPDGHHDTMRAIDWMAERGYSRVMGFGVSYGASLSLYACHGHENMVGAIMVNLPRLRMREDFERPRWMVHGREAPAEGEGSAGEVDAGSVLPPPTEQERREVHAMMAGLRARGIPLHMLFGEEDPGPHELVRFFGPRLEGLEGIPDLHASRVHRLDHGMLHPPGRRHVFDYCIAVLTGEVHRLAGMPLDWIVPGQTQVGRPKAGEAVPETMAP